MENADKKQVGKLPRGEALLSAHEDQISAYLADSDQPEWEFLKRRSDFNERWVAKFLSRHRVIPEEQLRLIYEDRDLRKSYWIRRALIKCRNLPQAVGLSLVATLRWADLIEIMRLPYLPGAVRHRIESQVLEVLPGLALGQKIALAKQAPRDMIKHLREAAERPVVQALLRNFFFTFEDAMYMANSPKVRPSTLEILAGSDRWSKFKEIRFSLLRNHKTPRSVILPLVRRLTLEEARKLIRDHRMPMYTRKIIDRIFGKQIQIRR